VHVFHHHRDASLTDVLQALIELKEAIMAQASDFQTLADGLTQTATQVQGAVAAATAKLSDTTGIDPTTLDAPLAQLQSAAASINSSAEALQNATGPAPAPTPTPEPAPAPPAS
jgi:lysozyme family protein